MDTGGGFLPHFEAPVNNKVDRWLVDTFCGYDLVSRDQASSMKQWVGQAVKSWSFQTANGNSTTEQVARMTVDEWGGGGEVAPYILDSTPAVLSVGYILRELGIRFLFGRTAKVHTSGYQTVRSAH